MKAALALLMALTALTAPSRAFGTSDLLKNARNTFDYGDYEQAGRLAESLLASHQLAEERDLVEAYRLAGLAAFYLNRTEQARRDFVGLLSVDPDYAMDPFLVPPAAVAFFDGVKRDNESLLAPIRERRKALAEQERLAEEARHKLIEENLRRQSEPDRPVLVQRTEVRSFVVNFLPLGAGQLQESRFGWGVAFASIEGLSVIASVGSYVAIERLRQDTGDYRGYFSSADYPTAKRLNVVKLSALGVLGGALVAGTVDSLLHYKGEVSSIVALPQPPARKSDAPPSPAPPAPPPTSAVPSASRRVEKSLSPSLASRALRGLARSPARFFDTLSLAPFAMPDGAGLSLFMRF